MAKKAAQDPFAIAGTQVEAGTRRTVLVPLSRLPDHTDMTLRVKVIHGRRPGPVLFVSAAIHGDEIIGLEIIRRLVSTKTLSRIRGTLILIPVVNGFGFLGMTRYLPDRRDLNRVFPGSANGSSASQLAHTFINTIVGRCDYGIDLHSGAVHRENLPQIRANLSDSEVRDMGVAFRASIMLDAKLRDGSLRAAAGDVGCRMLVYEAGEALRFNESAVRIGVRGVMGVIRHVGMLPKLKPKPHRIDPVQPSGSSWVRAPMSGLMRAATGLGDSVQKGQRIAGISDPLGETDMDVLAKHDGVVIGRTNLPVVSRGDALFHIARVGSPRMVGKTIEKREENAADDPIFKGPEIV